MTQFIEIYEKFTESTGDLDFIKLTQEQAEEIFYIYLNKSISLDFKCCKKNLKDYDKTNKQFNMDLTNEEQWILAIGMKLNYIQMLRTKSDYHKLFVGNRDYQRFSPANQLQQLKDLEKDIKKELKSYLSKYQDFSKVNGD